MYDKVGVTPIIHFFLIAHKGPGGPARASRVVAAGAFFRVNLGNNNVTSHVSVFFCVFMAVTGALFRVNFGNTTVKSHVSVCFVFYGGRRRRCSV